MKEDIIQRGKDWFQFQNGMADYLLAANSKKKYSKSKTKAIPNDTVMAPHSAQRSNIIMTRL